jgi:glucose/arabinose dehydrogenase
MDYGPFLAYSLLAPGAPSHHPTTRPTTIPHPLPWQPTELLAHRGITVKLPHNASICFDADQMRYAAAWTGGWLDLSKSHLANEKGSIPPAAVGEIAFTTPDAPGFADSSGSYVDPREGQEGPLPRTWAHYEGLYRHADRVIFAYTVGPTRILDMPGATGDAEHLTFTRTLRIAKSDIPIRAILFSAQGGIADATGADTTLSVGSIRLSAHGPPGTHVHADGKLVELTIPADQTPCDVRTSIGPDDSNHDPSPTTLTHGGPSLWPNSIETPTTPGPDKDAYTVDTISLPEKNPWNAWMRLTALDFFSDGRCAVTTWNGDVWIVSGLADPKLQHVTWKRFASGLYDPLGCRIVHDQLYVLARDGIYRLHDLNGDGEADFYECFNNDRPVGARYNAFAMELQTDSAGNFYYTVAGNAAFPGMRQTACLIKVSKGGQTSEVAATGLRTANGMGVGPNDFITLADNQGNWVPTSNLLVYRPGAFYGFEGDPTKFTKAQLNEQLKKHPTPDHPLCWIPYGWDNSSGGQVWTDAERFGPLSKHLLHTSYGKAKIFAVLPEQIDGTWQAALLQLPLRFDSGIQRARVNPIDGQLYVAGLHGWQTAGARDGCLHRIRYTGKPFYLPTSLHVREHGLQVGFSAELDPAAAQDAENYAAEQWTYHWSEAYGSSEYRVSNPNEKGHDALDIKRVTLAPDHKSLLLDIPTLAPVMQYELKLRLTAADGTPIKCDLAGTINPPERK